MTRVLTAVRPVLEVHPAPGGQHPAAVPKPFSRGAATLLAGLIALGLVLRVFPLRGLWSDEAISVEQARLPFWDMIRQLGTLDIHPPMWASLLWVDIRLLGDGPLAVRVPSILLGLAAIPVAYLAGRELFDERAGLAAAALTAICPIAVWYSGEARMYAAYMLFSFLAVLGQAKALRRPEKLGGWLPFAVASAALFYTQYFSAFQVIAQNLVFVVLIARQIARGQFRPRDLFVPWLVAAGLALALVLPLMPYLFSQLIDFNGPGGGGGSSGAISLYAVLANLVWAGWGYHSDAIMVRATALWPLVMLGVLVLLGKGRSSATNLLATLVVLPLACVYALGSLVSSTMFELRYFICIVPPLLLLAGRAVTAWAGGRVQSAVALGVVSLTMLVALVDQQFDGSNPRLYDYQGAFDVVAAEGRPDDVLVYGPAFTSPLVDYYAPRLRTVQLGSDVPPLRPGGGAKTFVMGSFLDEPDTASAVGGVLAQLEQQGWAVHETVQKDNVTLWVLQ